MERLPEFYTMYGAEFGKVESQQISEVERLLNEFERHESQEGEYLKRYKEIAEKTQNPFIRFLLQHIVSDEEKHHATTSAIVSTLKGDLKWTSPEGAIRGLYDLKEVKNELLSLTEEFIQLEKRGIKDYKELIRESEGYYRGLFVLLLQSMIRDSEKHVEILVFLRERLNEA